MRAAKWLIRFFTIRAKLLKNPVRAVSNIPIVFIAILHTVGAAVRLLFELAVNWRTWTAEERGLALWGIFRGSFIGKILRCIDMKVKVLRRENIPQGLCLLVSNHESVLDHLVFGYALERGRFVLKSGILSIPIVGWAIKYSAQLPIRRFKGSYAMESIRKGILEWTNCPVIIYAEGTRKEKNGEMLGPFKTGAARIALEFGIPIIPVAISGTGKILPPGPFCALRRHQCAQIQFGDPIMPFGDFAQLTKKTRAQILKMLVFLEAHREQ